MNGYGRGEDNLQKKEKSVITRETVGMTMLIFSVILLVICFVGKYIFGEIGVAITAFLLGLFGFFAYPLLIYLVYLSLYLVSGKKMIATKWIAHTATVVISVFLIVHLATSAEYFGNGYGSYLSGCWGAASEGVSNATGGGVVFGLFVYPIRAILSNIGTYVLFALLLAASVFFFLWATPFKGVIQGVRPKEDERHEEPEEDELRPVGVSDYTTYTETSAPYETRNYRVTNTENRGRIYEEQSKGQTQARSNAAETLYGTRDEGRDEAAASSTEKPSAREILYSSDTTKDFRQNLLYNREQDSRRAARRTQREENYETNERPEPETYAPRPRSDQSEGYQKSYGEGEPKRAMPRKIVEQRAEEESAEDLNYPVRPSYRAPLEESSAPRDYYANDVPLQPSETDDMDEPTETTMRAERAEPVERIEDPTERLDDYKPREDRPAYYREEREETQPRDRYGEETPKSDDSRTQSRDRLDGSGTQSRDRLDDSRTEPRERFDESRGRAADARGLGQNDSIGFGDRNDNNEKEEGESRAIRNLSESARLFDDDIADEEEPQGEVPPARGREIKETSAPQRHVYKPYVRPSLDIFSDYNDNTDLSPEDIDNNSAVIVETLAAFRIEAQVINVTVGPAVTRYDIDVPRNVEVRSVIKRDAEIAMWLHSRDGVNIYNNTEKGVISIEVPKPSNQRSTVGLKDVMQADEYRNAKKTALMFAIGKDVEGRNICGDICKMTHLLVAGATNSGKSVCLNAMLISLICKYSPEELRLILIDPKKVEFSVYAGLPHLMINEIIADAQRAVSALNWAIKEMERRYELFEQKTRGGVVVRNVDEYNANKEEDDEPLPKIVIVVDELADLMSVAKKDIEERIQRLTQKARAAGIHLVIATQRPSVDVITGVIKGNLPTRIAFRVIQEVDSRTILDDSGAEKLLGNGDMLYKTGGMFRCSRVQGAFVSSGEVQMVVDEIKRNNEAYFDPQVEDYINEKGGGSSDGDDEEMDMDNVNEEYIDALRMSVRIGSTSISFIQRKCKVGYNHAGHIIEWMELMGYITPFDGKAKARTVLLTKEEFESKYGSLD